MKFQNVTTDGLLELGTRDALSFLNALTSYRILSEAKHIHTGLASVIVNKSNSLMTTVTLLVQTFDGLSDEGTRYFVFTQNRGTKFDCSNSIQAEETDRESWLMEAHFIKRFKELV